MFCFTDSRGIQWKANLGETAIKPCPTGTNGEGKDIVSGSQQTLKKN